MLLAGAESGSESLVLARVVEAVADHNARSGRTRAPGLSIGAAIYDPEQPVTLDELITQAEQRMRAPSEEP
jgi:GGDEF domain-containing protein